MKKIIFIILTLTINIVSYSQVVDAEKDLKKVYNDTIDGWKKGAVFSLNLSQVSLTNWSAGGQNSISINGLANMFAIYKMKKTSWENYLNLGYGLLKQGKESDFIKTDDKIEFVSKYGKKASKSWYYSALLSFNSQFTNGYNYPNDSVEISKFLAPGYVLGAVGMDYKPNKNFSSFIAPFTSKITIVNDKSLSDNGAFGIDTGKVFRNEFGGYIRLAYNKEISKNIVFTTKLDLFSNYLHNPQNIDINFETLINIKLNKFLSAVITTSLIYDDDIKIGIDTNNDGIIDKEVNSKIQFKEVLGIGLSYNF